MALSLRFYKLRTQTERRKSKNETFPGGRRKNRRKLWMLLLGSGWVACSCYKLVSKFGLGICYGHCFCARCRKALRLIALVRCALVRRFLMAVWKSWECFVPQVSIKNIQHYKCEYNSTWNSSWSIVLNCYMCGCLFHLMYMTTAIV